MGVTGAPIPAPQTASPVLQLPMVVIGGSAGALSALIQIVQGLPADFPGVILVTLHLPRDFPGALPELLGRAGPLPARFAVDGEALEPGRIYVAPPDQHLQVNQNLALLSRGPRENQSRPSIDVLFRSAALSCGAGAMGVLLSGLMNDGVSGLWTLKQVGGCAVVQHPEEAESPSMPLSALQQVEVDDILPAAEIAGCLVAWATSPNFGAAPTPETAQLDLERLKLETQVAAGANALQVGMFEREALSPMTCPECHGVLVSMQEGQMLRFRCHTGHAFTAMHLLEGVRRTAETALWSAARAFDEEGLLLEQLRQQADGQGQTGRAAALRDEYAQAVHDANLLRALLMGRAARTGEPH